MCKECKRERIRQSRSKLENVLAALAKQANLNPLHLQQLWHNQQGRCSITGAELVHGGGNTNDPFFVCLLRHPITGEYQLVALKVKQVFDGLGIEEVYLLCQKVMENLSESVVKTHVTDGS